MEIVGILKLATEVENYPSGFYKREFVLTTKDQYPQDIKFELLKEKVELLRMVNSGDEIKVSFEIRGREYSGKYYNSLVAWKIEKSEGGQTVAAAASTFSQPLASEVGVEENILSPDSGDGLPF
jgi:hypothetical protein